MASSDRCISPEGGMSFESILPVSGCVPCLIIGNRTAVKATAPTTNATVRAAVSFCALLSTFIHWVDQQFSTVRDRCTQELTRFAPGFLVAVDVELAVKLLSAPWMVRRGDSHQHRAGVESWGSSGQFDRLLGQFVDR